jgi:hypothetical protein
LLMPPIFDFWENSAFELRELLYTVKKICGFPLSAGMSVNKLSRAGKENLVSDIPAGVGKSITFFTV